MSFLRQTAIYTCMESSSQERGTTRTLTPSRKRRPGPAPCLHTFAFSNHTISAGCNNKRTQEKPYLEWGFHISNAVI